MFVSYVLIFIEFGLYLGAKKPALIEVKGLAYGINWGLTPFGTCSLAER
jgi:hypothetical protein